MTDLFNAIYTRYQAIGLAGSLTAFYNTKAPETAVYPYGVFNILSVVPDWTFGEEFENCLLQFNLFSKTADATEVCSLFELLKTGFDFHDLAISNYQTVSMTRENAILTQVEDVWQYSVTYRILLQKD
jgi:hypothetical protein